MSCGTCVKGNEDRIALLVMALDDGLLFTDAADYAGFEQDFIKTYICLLNSLDVDELMRILPKIRWIE